MSEELIHEAEATRSRRGIATFFRRFSRRLGNGEKVPVNDEQTVAFDPPAEAEFEVDIERENGEIHLEIEMGWDAGEGDVDLEADESKATFELYRGNDDEHRWRLRHDNGNIIADGSQGYASKEKAKQGIHSVQNNAAGGHVIDLSRDESVDVEAAGSKATFEVYEDEEAGWRWRLQHDNGNIIADSGQGYASKQKARQGLQSVKTNASGAAVEETD